MELANLSMPATKDKGSSASQQLSALGEQTTTLESKRGFEHLVEEINLVGAKSKLEVTILSND